MSKLIINNFPGHYEGSGFEVDVSTQQIVIRSTGGYQQNNNQPRKDKQKNQNQQPSRRDDDNPSLLNSIGIIADKIRKR